MTDGVRMTKSNIRRVIGTKTGSADCHTMTVTFAAREIEDVPHDYVFIRVMCVHPVGWMKRFIVKALQIDRVRAINRHPASIDVAAQGADQTKILVLIIA